MDGMYVGEKRERGEVCGGLNAHTFLSVSAVDAGSAGV